LQIRKTVRGESTNRAKIRKGRLIEAKRITLRQFKIKEERSQVRNLVELKLEL
jgi:hypothetical protein